MIDKLENQTSVNVRFFQPFMCEMMIEFCNTLRNMRLPAQVL